MVVVGGGFGGLAVAARLARQRHDVTVLEASDEPGGAAGRVVSGEFTWDAGPVATLLPAVLRDLFRKTGGPLEDEVDLVPRGVLREHRFTDGTSLALPGGSRAAQRDAVETLGPGLGERWCAHVDAYAATWETLRGELVERPWDPEVASREARAVIGARSTLRRRLRRDLPDERLRLVAAHPFVADGHDPRNVPAWAGLHAYLEQTFGSWTVEGGLWQVTAALEQRCARLGVDLRTGVEARDLVVRGGRVAAVDTSAGEVDADAVVVAADPRRLPALAGHVARTMPAMPPVTAHLGLTDAERLPELPGETVLHGDPVLVVRTGGAAPPGGAAWTVHARGRIAEDPEVALARAGIDVRAHVEERQLRSPLDLVRRWRGSPLGVLWQGRGTVGARLGPETPVPGVWACGAHAAHGSGLPWVGASAALVAAAVGRA